MGAWGLGRECPQVPGTSTPQSWRLHDVCRHILGPRRMIGCLTDGELLHWCFVLCLTFFLVFLSLNLLSRCLSRLLSVVAASNGRAAKGVDETLRTSPLFSFSPTIFSSPWRRQLPLPPSRRASSALRCSRSCASPRTWFTTFPMAPILAGPASRASAIPSAS